MDVTPLIPEGRQLIEGYGDGGFRVTGTVHKGPVIIFPDRCVPWPAGTIETLSLESLAPVFEGDDVPEILLIGCGVSARLISPKLRADIRARGPVVDAMNTGAACRTYNVLLSEARRVAAALIPVG